MVLRILDWDHRGTKCPHTESTRVSSLGRDSVVYSEREDSQEVKCECVTGKRKCKACLVDKSNGGVCWETGVEGA